MTRIVADIGNTVCKLALVDGLKVETHLRLPHEALHDPAALNEAFAGLLEGKSTALEVVVCSVVPALSEALQAYCKKKGYTVRPVIAENLPNFKLAYATVETLGVDRYCTALCAAGMAGPPCITIDMGTATTVNVVNEEGYFVGGAIGPGMRTGYKALHAYTAQLPALEPRWPEAFTGATTEESIHVGTTAIHVLGLKTLVEKISEGFSVQPHVFFTGGNMQIIPQEVVPEAVFEPHMVTIGASMYADAKKREKVLRR